MEDKIVFYRVSQWLTGFQDLSEQMADKYLNLLKNKAGYKDYLPELMLHPATRCNNADAVLKLIRDATHSDLSKLVRGIVFLWYTGELIPWDELDLIDVEKQQRSIDDPTDYYGALLWKAIRAHPPGLSGGYHGYWKYEPEN